MKQNTDLKQNTNLNQNTKQNRYEIDMCHGPIMSKLISFSIPLMISGCLQLLFNAVDLMVVGRFTGSDALAAVGANTALINLFTNFFIGISLGANVIAARYYATDQEKEMSDTVHTAMTTALLSGILVMVCCLLLSRQAQIWMGTPDTIIDQAVLYFRIYFCGMPFFMMYNYGAAILRAIGDTKRPLLFLIIAGITNALLNLFMVIVLHLGVAGVAIATVASQVISCLLILGCLTHTTASYRLQFSRLRLKPYYMKRMFRVGVPAGIQSTLITFSNVLLQSSVNSFGADAMAGYTAANNLLGFLYTAINSVSQACMSFMSQNFAVLKFKRMDRILKNCILLSCIIAGILGSAFYFFGNNILQIYTSDPTVIRSGMDILAICCPLYLLCGIMDLLPAAMRGLGHSTAPMFLSLIGVVGIRILWIFGVFPYHRTLFFLFISYPVSWIVTILMQGICYMSVRKKEWKEA